MNTKKFLELMKTMEKMKCTTRHSFTSSGRQESVAEHSWQLAMMALLVQDEFPDADINKVIHMCLIHDLGEIFTGDIPAFEKTMEHEETEKKLFLNWISTFPELYRDKFYALYKEMEELQTLEAKIYKALDKMEAVIQHNHADITTWIPLEYELQFTYGERQVEFSEYLRKLKNEINHQTRDKIDNKIDAI